MASVLQYLYFDSLDNRSLSFLWPADSRSAPFSTDTQRQHTISISLLFQPHAHTQKPAPHHLKQVYTRDCSMKGTFDAQSKPLQCAVQQQPVRSAARHLASPYRSRLPVRASAFPIIAAQEIRLQPSEGNKNPPLSFFHNLEPSKSFALPLLVLASHALRNNVSLCVATGRSFHKAE